MSVLILHRGMLGPWPYLEWLGGEAGDVVLLAAADRLFGEDPPSGNQGYAALELVQPFNDDDLVLPKAIELAERHGVEHIVATHEADLLRAAQLRERLGLAGPRPDDIRPFRDKFLMKELARKGGINAAAQTVPRTAQDVRDFAAEQGFPVVLKNRLGFASIGMHIPQNAAELEECITASFSGPPRDDLLLEAYVPGQMSHVDGLVVDGETALVWPLQYQHSLGEYESDTGAIMDLTLGPDDPLTERLIDFNEEIMRALRREGGGLRSYAFHAEIFHTPDDRLVLCEIACRAGGAKIRDMFEVMFGINLSKYALRAELGLDLPGLEPGRMLPRSMAGQVAVLKRPGVVRSIMDPPMDSWVKESWFHVKPGEELSKPVHSSDYQAVAVVTGPTRELCEQRARALGARFEREIVIST